MVGTKFDIHSWSGCGYRIPTGRSLSLFCPSYLILISFFVSKIQFNISYFFQILGICFAQNLRADIFAQMAKWN